MSDKFWEDLMIELMRGKGMTPFEIVTSSNVLMFQEVVS